MPLSSAGRSLAAPVARWFIALWPDDATRDALQALQARWSWPPHARPTRAERLHLTLHFLGALPEGALVPLCDALDAVRAAPPRWSLRCSALWRGGTATVEPARIPAAARTLHDALAEVLRAQGLGLEDRPWRPHVTLARCARGALAPAAFDPIEWTARGFELVGSDAGYRRVARWPLVVPPREGAAPRRAALSPSLPLDASAQAPPGRGARGWAAGRSSR
jgi:2'-5' RNA ligase